MCLISRDRELQTEGAVQQKERCPHVLLWTCGMRRVLESEEERSCLDGVHARHTHRGCIRGGKSLLASVSRREV